MYRHFADPDLAGSKSEKIVPYWHSYVHRSPEGIAEVKEFFSIHKFSGFVALAIDGSIVADRPLARNTQ